MKTISLTHGHEAPTEQVSALLALEPEVSMDEIIIRGVNHDRFVITQKQNDSVVSTYTFTVEQLRDWLELFCDLSRLESTRSDKENKIIAFPA
jgi:hypothetical protein